MIIAIVAVAAFLIGVLMIAFGVKLVKFSLKYLIALVFCLGLSYGFWNNVESAAPTATVVGERTIEFEYPVHHVSCTVKAKLLKEVNHQVVFDVLPKDDMFVVTAKTGLNRFYQITRDVDHIADVVELDEPVGWMTRYANPGDVK